MTQNKLTVGILGFGNMGQAIATGWVKMGALTAEQIIVSAHNQEKLQKNAQKLDVQAAASNTELVKAADIVIMAVKPYLVKEVVAEVGDALTGKILVSIATGIYATDYADILTTETEHLSIMPNTPVSVGEGTVMFEDVHNLSDAHYQEVKALFETISEVVTTTADKMDVGAVVSGCGPAFLAMVIEAFADGAVKYGLDRETAYALASQTLVGTGKMQLETGLHPGQLKDQVTSPAGTTIKGVAALEANGVRDAFISCFDAILGEEV